ncbi:MAG TPA: hypothetical protein VJ837_04835, partial [Candidatus Paceibacterota bacterium]|nr:hypothetical protein [Candidatus Paceibacterota bacterium]
MKKQLPFLIVALAIVVLFPFNRAEAVDGAMILNVGTPSVSGSAVTLSATTNSGTVQCGDAPERTPFCFCCDPTFGDKGDWQT